MTVDATLRPYDPARDAAGLWACKQGFEEELGTGTGDDEKAAAYAEKLTPAYRREWLAWVERCVADDERCVTLAVDGADGAATEGDASPDGSTVEPAEVPHHPDPGHVLGYVFVLPERLAYVWDAAVLNEIFVRPVARGSDVADDLMGAAVDLAHSQTLPLDRLVLDVDRANERATAFYDRHGFDHWGVMVAKEL